MNASYLNKLKTALIMAAAFSTALLTLGVTSSAKAVVFGGVDFPQGATSFADEVIRYNPNFQGGPAPTDLNFTNPDEALGVPDYVQQSSTVGFGAVALGRGGLIELKFVDNLLTNSGNSNPDLFVFEVGRAIEDTFIAVRPTAATLAFLNPFGDANSDGFWEVGEVSGSTSSIDIDSFFSGFTAGTLAFDAVQLIDDRNSGISSGPFVGADIDAVGAISSIQNPTAVPTPALLPGLISIGIAAICNRKKQPKERP